MRWLDRLRGNLPVDELDQDLAALFPRAARHSEVDRFHLARARVRIDAHLSAPTRTGGLARRLTLAGFGGGSMWAGLVGAAAAHKAAAAAVGLSVLLSGSVAVETSGVGPAVREVVRHVTSSETESQDAAPAVQIAASAVTQGGASVAPGDQLPGNLVAKLQPNGSFQLRAEVVSADGTVLVVNTPDGQLEIDISDIDIHTTGKPTSEVDWSLLVGYGVIVSGSCVDPDPGANGSLSGCGTLAAARVQLLGQAGQHGAAGETGVSAETGAPEGAGKPEGIGQLDVTPPGGRPIVVLPVSGPPTHLPPVNASPVGLRGTR